MVVKLDSLPVSFSPSEGSVFVELTLVGFVVVSKTVFQPLGILIFVVVFT